tara:strand:+ start:4040 stop:5290 length:1251 start_codon:yes stop_codon:yes gene_type:complete
MKKLCFKFPLLAVIITSLLTGVVYGGTPTTATTIIPITITNSQTSVVTSENVSVPISMKSLIDSGYIALDGFNMHLHEGTTDTYFMPGTDRLDIRYAFNNASVEETTQATNSTADDITLPAADTEVYEFALDHPSRILHINVSQTVVAASYVISWEYYNGSTWVSLSSVTTVTDNTTSFSILGSSTVELTAIPTDWARSILHTSKSGHWIRAVAAASGVTTVPLATQAWYETGRFFFNVSSISPTDQGDYDLYTGGDDMTTFHYYFPGFSGIQTADDADLEPDGLWSFRGSVGLKLDSGETGNIIEKTSSFTLGFTASATVGGNNTLTLNAPSSTRYGEWTHNEEDGSAYYSGTSIESYSKSFYNGASNYITAREENDADILSNTSSEVTSHKVGQAYDKVIDTTPAFGAKLNDPS